MNKHRYSKQKNRYNKAKHAKHISQSKPIKFTKNKYSSNKFKGKRIKKHTYQKNNRTRINNKNKKKRLANTKERKDSYKGNSRIFITRRNRSHGTNKRLFEEFGSFNPTKKKQQSGGGLNKKTASSCRTDKKTSNMYTQTLRTIIKKNPKKKGIFKWGDFRKQYRQNFEDLGRINECAYLLFHGNCYRNLMKEAIKNLAIMIEVLVKLLSNQCRMIAKLGNTPYYNMLVNSNSDFRKIYDNTVDNSELILKYYDLFKYSYETNDNKRKQHKQHDYKNRNNIVDTIKQYTENSKKLRKYMINIKKSFAVAIEVHYMYRKSTDKLDGLIDTLSKFSGSMGGTEIEKVDKIKTKLDEEFGADELDDESIIEEVDFVEEDDNFNLNLSIGQEDLTDINDIDQFFSIVYNRIVDSRSSLEEEYVLKTFLTNKYLWSAVSFKNMYQLLEQVNNRNSDEVYPEYIHQKIAKKYINPDIGYSIILMSHPSDTGKYYLPQKELGAKAKFKLAQPKNEKHITAIDKKIVIGSINSYRINIDGYKNLWNDLLDEKINNDIIKKWSGNSINQRNTVKYVMDGTIKSLLNIVVGHRMSLKKGKGSGATGMVIPGLVPYFTNILLENMPTSRETKLFRRKQTDVTHGIYDIPLINLCYKPILPFPSTVENDVIMEYNNLINAKSNTFHEQVCINHNKISMLTDVNNIYTKTKIIPNMIKYKSPNYESYINKFADILQLISQSDIVYPKMINSKTGVANREKYCFYRGYLMDRQYFIYNNRTCLLNSSFNNDLLNADLLVSPIDNLHTNNNVNIIDQANDIYHWAGKPKYTDGLIEYVDIIDGLVKGSFGHFNKPHDISFLELENINKKKFDIVKITSINKDADQSYYNNDFFNEAKTIRNGNEHLHNNILKSNIKKIQFNNKHIFYERIAKNNLVLNPIQMERSLFTETEPNLLYFIIVNCLHFTKYFQNVYDQHITNITDFNDISYMQPNKVSNKYDYYLNYFNPDPKLVDDKEFKALEYDNYGFIETNYLTKMIKKDRSATGKPIRLGQNCLTYYDENNKKYIDVKPNPEVYHKYRSTQYNNNNSIVFLTTPFFTSSPDLSRTKPVTYDKDKDKDNIGLGPTEKPSMNYNMPFRIYQIPYYRQERDARNLMLLGNHRHNYNENNLRLNVNSKKFKSPIDHIPNFWYRIQSYLEHVNQSLKDLSLWLPFKSNIRNLDLSLIDPFYDDDFMKPENYYVPPGFYDKDGFFSLYHHDLEDRLMLYKAPIEFFNVRPTNMRIYDTYNNTFRYIDPYNMMKYPHYFCMGTVNEYRGALMNSDEFNNRADLNVMTVLSKPSVLLEIIFLYVLQMTNINLYDDLHQVFKNKEKYKASDTFLNEYLTMLYYIFLPTILVGSDIDYNNVNLAPLTASQDNNTIENNGIKYKDNQLKNKYYRPIFQDTVSNMFEYLKHSPGGSIATHTHETILQDRNRTFGRFKEEHQDKLGGKYTFNIPFLPAVQLRNPMIMGSVGPSKQLANDIFVKYLHKTGDDAYNRRIYDIAITDLQAYFIELTSVAGNNQIIKVDNDNARILPALMGAIHAIVNRKYIFENNAAAALAPLAGAAVPPVTAAQVNHAMQTLAITNNIEELYNYKILLLEKCAQLEIISVEEYKDGIWNYDEHDKLLTPELRRKYPKSPYINLDSFGRRNEKIYESLLDDTLGLNANDNPINRNDPNKFVDSGYQPLNKIISQMANAVDGGLIPRRAPPNRPNNLNLINFNVDVTDKYPWRHKLVKALKNIVNNTGKLPNFTKELDLFIIREHKYQTPNIKLHCSVRAQKFIERYLTMYETVGFENTKQNLSHLYGIPTGHEEENSLVVEMETFLDKTPGAIIHKENSIHHRLTDPYKRNSKNLHLMNLYNMEPVYPQAYPDVTKYFPTGLGPFYDKKLMDTKSGYSSNYIPDDTLPKEKYVQLEKLFKQPIQMNPNDDIMKYTFIDTGDDNKGDLESRLNMQNFEWRHRTSQDHFQLTMDYKKRKHFIPMGRQADFDFPWENACDINSNMMDINNGLLPVSQLIDPVEDIKHENKIKKEVKFNWAMNYRHKPVYVMNGLFLPEDMQIDEHTEIKQFFDENKVGVFEFKVDQYVEKHQNPALLTHYEQTDNAALPVPVLTIPATRKMDLKGTNKPDLPKETPDAAISWQAHNQNRLPENPSKTAGDFVKNNQYIVDMEAKVKNSSFKHLGFLPSGLHPDQVQRIELFLNTKRNLVKEIEIETGKKVISNILKILRYHKHHLGIITRSMKQNSNNIQDLYKSTSQLIREKQKIGLQSSTIDKDGKVKFSMQDSLSAEYIRDGTSEKFFKLTEDIMLYFVPKKDKRHLFGYTEMLNVVYALTDILIDIVIMIAGSYGFIVNRDILLGVYSADKKNSFIVYEDTIADKSKIKLDDNIDGFNFNNIYIELMKLFQQDEQDRFDFKPEDLVNPDVLAKAIKPNMGINLINHIYINKIKVFDYHKHNIDSIKNPTIDELFKAIRRKKEEQSKLYLGRPIDLIRKN
jgi:hypothetical protein